MSKVSGDMDSPKKNSQPMPHLQEELNGARRRTTRARPVSRRSISSELFPGGYPGSPSVPSMDHLDTFNKQSLGREFGSFCDKAERAALSNFGGRSPLQGRPSTQAVTLRRRPSSPPLPLDDLDNFSAAAGMSSFSAAHRRPPPILDDFNMNFSAAAGRRPRLPPPFFDDFDDHFSAASASSPALKRADWRRTSVPDHGQGYRSLPRRSNR